MAVESKIPVDGSVDGSKDIHGKEDGRVRVGQAEEELVDPSLADLERREASVVRWGGALVEREEAVLWVEERVPVLRLEDADGSVEVREDEAGDLFADEED